MTKRFSPRGQAAMENRLGAQELRLRVCNIQTATVLQRLRTILVERQAVEDGFLTLSQQRRVELANVILAGTSRHEKLCLVILGQLDTIANVLAERFEVYLHTYKRLFGAQPTEDDVRETM